jgi:hypothetical protein
LFETFFFFWVSTTEVAIRLVTVHTGVVMAFTLP